MADLRASFLSFLFRIAWKFEKHDKKLTGYCLATSPDVILNDNNSLILYKILIYVGLNILQCPIQSCALSNWIYFRFRCGSAPVPVNWNCIVSHHILRYLRTLYIVWSLVRRRDTRRLTRLQTIFNVIRYCKILKNGSVWLRCGCGYFFNLLKNQYCTWP